MWTDPAEAASKQDTSSPAVTPAEGRMPPPRPAILLGYGDFGHTLLRRFLTSAALRGSLEWEAPPGGASPAERYLRDLAPIWVEDHLAPAGQDHRWAKDEPARLEVMRDLLGQIRHVPASSSQAEDLAEAVEAAVGSILAAPVQHRRGGRPGLDVFLLAKPQSAKTLGSLDRLARPLMDLLENHNFLRRARRTSYLAIYDFDNYWDLSPGGRRLRGAFRKSVDRWSRRRIERRPAFDRFYLVDGKAEAGERSEAHRIDEITLFLELMFFEGQRGELQRLFQAHTPGESTVYSFGVRVMERRSALLSRCAAAEFGEGWLEFLSGGGSREDVPEELRRRLEPYRPAALERALAADELREELDQTLGQLEEELVHLLTLPGDDGLDQVRRRYKEVTAELWNRLQERAGRRLDTLSRDRLSRLQSDLEAAIETDLHEREHPVPLGVILREVDDTLAELAALEPAPGEAPTELEELSRCLEEVTGSYERFRTDRLHVDKLQLWWFLFALATSVGVAPLLTRLLQDVPRPDPLGSHLLALGWAALQKVADPIAMSLLVLGIAWGIGGIWVQRRIHRRLKRAERAFQDPQQGRLADRLRQALGPGGSLRTPIEERLDRLVQDLVLTVRSAVRRELGRVREWLGERHREMGWLRQQLHDFGRVHGGTLDDRSEIRWAVEGPGEYERMLSHNPPSPPRYRSTQRELHPFAEWNQPWCDAFLYPLSFIERLSSIYRDPIERELSRPGEGPEQERWASAFQEFVERHGGSPVAFQWIRQDGLPPEERFCLLPPLWRNLRNVRGALGDIAVDERHLLVSRDTARSYLLRIQGGVDSSFLVASETMPSGRAVRPAAADPSAMRFEEES